MDVTQVYVKLATVGQQIKGLSDLLVRIERNGRDDRIAADELEVRVRDLEKSQENLRVKVQGILKVAAVVASVTGSVAGAVITYLLSGG